MGLPITSERSSTLILTSDTMWLEADNSGSFYSDEGYRGFKSVEIEAKHNEKDYPNRIIIEYDYSSTYNGGSSSSKILTFKIYKENEVFYRDEVTTDSVYKEKHTYDSLLSEFKSIEEFLEKLQSSELANAWVVNTKKQSEPLKFLQKFIQEIHAPQSDDIKTMLSVINKDLYDREFKNHVIKALIKIFEPLNLCEDYEYEHKENPVEIPSSSLCFGIPRWTNNRIKCLKKLPLEIEDMVMGRY